MHTNSGNPKDAIGAAKIPLGLIPGTALAIASLAHYEGNVKYGRWNWRGNPVRASIYIDAMHRHVEKWINGEWSDPITRVPHLGSAIACLNIIIDAKACGTLIDDRPPSVDYGSFETDLMGIIANLDRLHFDKMPKHYTQADAIHPLTIKEGWDIPPRAPSNVTPTTMTSKGLVHITEAGYAAAGLDSNVEAQYAPRS